MMVRDVNQSGPIQFYSSEPDPVKRIQNYINVYVNHPEYQGFEALLMRTIKIVSARQTDASKDGMEAHTVFEIEAVEGLLNPMGNMHGGCVATLADMTTTMATAPVSQENFWEFGGVSRTLSVTYLKPVTKGMVVVVECMLRSIGKRLSVTQCEMRDKKTGTLLAMAEHGKAALVSQEGSRKRSSQL